MKRNNQLLGTALMLLAAIGVTGNRMSGYAISNWFGKLKCGDSFNAPIINDAGEAIMGDGVCGFNSDMGFIVAMMGLFLLGVAVNIYARIRATR